MPLIKPTYAPGKKGNVGQWSPSIDRIDNTKGYTKDNCRIVVWMFNLAKNNYKDTDLMKLSLAIVKNVLIDIDEGNKEPAFVKYLDGIQNGLKAA
ncbi:MAG: hypothetical protein QM500_06470 [Methylococcales bacterium]